MERNVEFLEATAKAVPYTIHKYNSAGVSYSPIDKTFSYVRAFNGGSTV